MLVPPVPATGIDPPGRLDEHHLDENGPRGPDGARRRHLRAEGKEMTMAGRRALAQPGPAAPVRIESFAGGMLDFDFAPETSVSLCEAITRPLRARGIRGAGVTLGGLRLEPLRYVIPAVSDDPAHVAWYSETHAPDGPVDVAFANVTVGEHEGEGFIHCHALWRDAAGRLRGGHILPEQTMVAAAGRALAFGSREIGIVRRFDPETGFSLFQPAMAASGAALGAASATANVAADGRTGVIARIRPNEDLVEGIEALCLRHGIAEAVIRSGVGSLIGARFETGPVIEEIPTEILVQEGRIATGPDGRRVVDLVISLIDTQGRVHTGRPVRGDNPVLICLELVIEIRRLDGGIAGEIA